MFKKVLLIALILVSFLFTACETVTVELRNKQLITTNPVQGNNRIIGHFKEDVRYWFTIGGLVNLNHPDLDNIVASQLLKYDGDGVCNLKIVDQYSGTDILISIGTGIAGYLIGTSATSGSDSQKAQAGTLGISLGGFLLSSRTLFLEGDIYKK